MSDQTKGILTMMLCATLWSIGGLFIKLLPWNAVAIAGARSLVAGCVVAIYMAVRRFRFRVTKRTVLVGLCLAGTALCFVGATKLTTAANAIVIQYTEPLFLLLFNAIFRKQRFHAADWAVVLTTTLGIGVFFLDKLGGGTMAGNVLALVAGMFFAGVFVTSGDAPDEERINGILQGQMITALVGMPVFFATGAVVTWQSLGCILALGVFQLGIAFVLFSIAAKTCPPLVCSLLAALEPLLNPVWVFLFAGEKPGTLSLVGGAVVVVAITAWCVWTGQRAAHEAHVKEAAL